ncbi:MAG: peptide-methionine (S)-S-oxide reductase MsrA [Pseudomonadota bacterium]
MLNQPAHLLPVLFLSLLLIGCSQQAATPAKEGLQTNATLVVAGGCFWCVESDFEKLAEVGDVLSGYSGGDSDAPTYRSHADHLEVVQVPYASDQVSYRELIDYFLRHIDPLDAGGQFCDRGHSYTTAVFYSNAAEQAAAMAAVAEAEAQLGQPLATQVLPLKKFWLAEDYHQDYYKKNPVRYKYYRNGCGRDQRVAEVWQQAAG